MQQRGEREAPSKARARTRRESEGGTGDAAKEWLMTKLEYLKTSRPTAVSNPVPSSFQLPSLCAAPSL
eukprot:1723525-Rhodomonas_salina.2